MSKIYVQCPVIFSTFCLRFFPDDNLGPEFTKRKGAIGLERSDPNLFTAEFRIGPFCSASAIPKRFEGTEEGGVGGSQSVEGPHPRPAVDKRAG